MWENLINVINELVTNLRAVSTPEHICLRRELDGLEWLAAKIPATPVAEDMLITQLDPVLDYLGEFASSAKYADIGDLITQELDKLYEAYGVCVD